MRHLLFLLLPLALLSLQCRSSQVSAPETVVLRDLPNSTLGTLYGRAMADCYEYMFSESGPTLTVSGKTYGNYRAGIKGLLLYSGLSDVVRDYLIAKGLPAAAFSRDFYDVNAYAQLSGGYAAFRTGERFFEGWNLMRNGEQSFHYYNPAIIRWGITNLIPDPNTDIGGQPAREVYDQLFQPFFRLLTDTYLGLEHGDVAAEVAAYAGNFSQEDFQAIPYLNERYNSQFPSYMNGKQDFSPGMATGFWLRREIDGTRALMWEGLSRIMTHYDAAWFASRQK